MDCLSFENRIHQLLDDRLTLTGDDMLMSHVGECAACEKVLNDYDSVHDSVKLLTADLAEILRETDTKTASRRFGSQPIFMMAALAATIFISVGVFRGLDHGQPDRSTPVVRNVVTPQPIVVASLNTVDSNQNENSISQTPPQPSQPKKSNIPGSSPPMFSNWTPIPTMEMPRVPTWDEICHGLDPLEPFLTYSSRIPSVQTVNWSLNMTIDFLKRSFQKSERKPDLGFWIDSDMLAAV